ncbi:MAG: TatD family hydrolase [Fimbriimonadaceae bacterium]|nr:TatD family hydrolase [Fimbriimonadaceae bacterium]
MLIDTHCHLNFADKFPDPAAEIALAAREGVGRLVVVGCDEETSLAAVELADAHEGVYAVVGWHPTSAASFNSAGLLAIEAMLAHPKVVAVGEIGLDFYWDFSTPEQQHRCLRDQLDLARAHAMPVVFHCREAWNPLLDVLEADAPQPYLFHCFSGDAAQAARALALGGVLGFDGPITYKKNDALRAIARDTPADRIVLETDSPYLSPEPFRGKPNRPANVKFVNAALAAARGISAEACAEMTTANAIRFFRLTPPA